MTMSWCLSLSTEDPTIHGFAGGSAEASELIQNGDLLLEVAQVTALHCMCIKECIDIT